MEIREFLSTARVDVRHGIRTLRRNPGFALTAVLSLVLGIGANTAIFQLLDALRLRSLPVDHPEKLVELQMHDASGNGLRGSFTDQDSPFSNPLWEAIQNQNQSLSGVFAWSHDVFSHEHEGVRSHMQALWVSGKFFQVLGVSPAIGRLLSSEDDKPGCAPRAVISYGMWQRDFGGSSGVIGTQMQMEGHSVEVIGVTPSSFFGLEVGKRFDLVVPICSEAVLRGSNTRLHDGASWWLTVMGRLKDGWSPSRISSEFAAESPVLFRATLPQGYPSDSVNDYLNLKLLVVPAGAGVSDVRERYANSLWLLLAIAASVFIIGCANLTNVMLARAGARESEAAMRLALGASRGRIIRQLTTEGLLLSVISAVLGALFAGVLSRSLVLYLSTQANPILLEVKWDWRVVLFIVALILVSCLAAGLIPAIRLASTHPDAAMKARTGSLITRQRKFGFRQALVTAQITLSFVLLVGALLFSHSLYNLLNLNVGFQESGIVITQLDLGGLNLKPDARLQLKRDLLQQLRTVPEVQAAAEAAIVPLSGGAVINRVWKDSPNAGRTVESGFNWISAEYFKTLRIPLLVGRDFDERDTTSSPKVAIVNESLARQLELGPNPIGQVIRRQPVGKQPEAMLTIVGLVKDAKYSELREGLTPVIFLSSSQLAQPDAEDQIVIRSNAKFSSLTSSLKNGIAKIAPGITFEFWSLSNYVRDGLLRERLVALLSAAFGFLGVVLVTVGVYGVISYVVSRRTGEIGIRMALGATRFATLTMIMRQIVALLLAGLVLGVVLAIILGRSVSALLFGVQPANALILAIAIGLLSVVTLVAGYIPAKRAANVDPMKALREL